jgi:hypothetical protein
MARGGAGAKVRPSLAGMAGPNTMTGRPGPTGDKPPRYEPAGRASLPAEVRRPPTPLKVPRPLVVEAEAGLDGPTPCWVVWRGKRRRVAELGEEWRVDEEWWRDEVSRHYFAVTLADGCRLTLFLDRLAGTWFSSIP